LKYLDYDKNLITRICYEFYYPVWRQHINKPQSLLRVILSFTRRCLHYLFFGDKKEPIAGKIIFFSTTENNNKSLRPVWDRLKSDEYVIWDRDEIFSESKILFFSFVNFYKFLWTYFTSSKDERLVMRQYDYWFTQAWGLYKVIDRFFLKNKDQIKLVVLANDESPENRCIAESCLKQQIKTLYTQHAAATFSLPNNIFSYSFLDGYDAFRKYSYYYPIKGKVFLSGSPRFDSYYGPKCPQYIGIATNLADDMMKAIDLCSFLKSKGYDNLILRPHPRQTLSDDIKVRLNNMNIPISEAKDESTFKFLSKLELLIANNSSIHFDAMVARVQSIKYNFASKQYAINDTVCDQYSFDSSGIVICCETFEDILQECENPSLISVNKIKEWNGAANTKHEGHVAELIASFITALINEDEEGNILDWIDSVFLYNEEGYYEYK